MSEPKNPQNTKSSSFSLKDFVFALMALTSLNILTTFYIAYKVIEPPPPPPPPLPEQVKALIENNKSTYESIIEINKSVPSHFKK